MKSTGMVRKVDELGRIVIPIEIRRTLGIDIKDPIEIFTKGDQVILRRYCSLCVFCNNMSDVISYNGKNICPDCVRAIKEA